MFPADRILLRAISLVSSRSSDAGVSNVLSIRASCLEQGVGFTLGMAREERDLGSAEQRMRPEACERSSSYNEHVPKENRERILNVSPAVGQLS